MASLTREEIERRIAIEDARIASAQSNITGLNTQIAKSQDEQTRLFALLEALPEEEAGV